MQRRLGERVREADLDAKDRNKEQEELEELRNKIFSGEFENPTQEYEKARKEHEKLYKPQIIIDVNQENIQRKDREIEKARDKQRLQELRYNSHEMYDSRKGGGGVSSSVDLTADSVPTNNTNASTVVAHNNNNMRLQTNIDSIESISNDEGHSRHESTSNVSSRYSHHGSESRDYINVRDMESLSPATPQGFHSTQPQNDNVPTPPIATNTVISLNLGVNAKKKKIESTAGVFNNDEDNDDAANAKKRKLVPLGRYFKSNQ